MLKNNTYLVSIIIPTYNRSQELSRAINSVLNQTYQNFEILVVDDGSEENLKIVCDSFKDKRICFYRNETHTNANVARNKGIKKAKGEYIAMLDSDDEFLPHHLERRIEKIKEWNCDGIFGSAYVYNGKVDNLALSRPQKINESFYNYLLNDGFAPTPSHFYKTSAAKNILWDETILRHQDYDFSFRFTEKYTFKSDYEPTIRIHWEPHHYQIISDDKFISQQTTINKYKLKISPTILTKYYTQRLRDARTNENPKAIKQYMNDINKNIQFLSLNEYITCHNKNSLPQKLYLRIKFAFKNILHK